jgi:REP element-mobilizing transposase RayT
MANTYSQINIQLIFSVEGKQNFLLSKFRNNLFRYIYGILKESGQFPLAVNGYLDHVHAFFELSANNSVSEISRIVKTNSSKWINENKFIPGRFNWQKGYGAFSYSRSQRNRVINYIINQEKHHQSITFKQEYLDLLKKFEVLYDNKYLFQWIE